MQKKISLFKGILLVAGTTIGGGMLALPVLTSLGGFVPSLVIYLLCWLFMASTGLLLLEACLWSKTETNLISMAGNTLGIPGKIAAWILYLFLFYCLTLAYIVGCGDLFSEMFQGSISEWQGSVLFVFLFAPFIFAGAHVVGRINVFLMVGLGISYLAFVFLGYQYINSELLLHRNWSLSLLGLPIAFTAFAFQGIIPTLVTYMDRDAKRIRTVILIGSFIPFITYVIWQALILGIVPVDGPMGLATALENGDNAVQPLKYFLKNPAVYIIGKFFAFFALVTSFFGVTLGLMDFLADGFGLKKTVVNKLFLCGIIFIPSLIFALTYPGVFLIALDYAGGYGCALLLGLLPIIMVWVGRYRLGYSKEEMLPGGRPLLVVLALFVFFELLCQIGIIS